MADLYAKNYKLVYVDKPSEKAGKGEYNGHVKTLYDEYTYLAEAGTADFIYLGKLPAGARVLSCYIKCPDTGATGIFTLGYNANGVDAANLTAFAVAVDPGAAAIGTFGAGTGIGKKFAAETTVVADFTEVTASATGDLLQIWINYIID